MSQSRVIVVGLGLIVAATVEGPAEDRLPSTQPALAKTIAWMRANTRLGPERAKSSEEVQDIRANINKFNNLTIEFGRGQTRSGRAYRLEIWAGEFFAFPLDEDQARRLGLLTHSSSIGHDMMHFDRRRTPPALSLDRLSIDHAEKLDGAKPITGQVHYRMLDRPKEKRIIRLGFTRDQGTRLLFVLEDDEDMAADEGMLRFSFDSINSEEDKGEPHAGPLVLFFEVCTVPIGRDGDVTILSNTLAALVNVTVED